MRAAKRPSR
ncbi:hypothetical protein VHUM_03686 [Vanrija humicola]|uniref:Uncharacterized protein n=1 Tax=Vanrija humicola TaxID=5417 RepID=A0A7D8Z046_VANHU|nr:hypothetical protein VHUM_03686 [Vanrija humicola]